MPGVLATMAPLVRSLVAGQARPAQRPARPEQDLPTRREPRPATSTRRATARRRAQVTGEPPGASTSHRIRSGLFARGAEAVGGWFACGRITSAKPSCEAGAAPTWAGRPTGSPTPSAGTGDPGAGGSGAQGNAPWSRVQPHACGPASALHRDGQRRWSARRSHRGASRHRNPAARQAPAPTWVPCRREDVRGRRAGDPASSGSHVSGIRTKNRGRLDGIAGEHSRVVTEPSCEAGACAQVGAMPASRRFADGGRAILRAVGRMCPGSGQKNWRETGRDRR
jgi:hypothetical protein